MLLLLLCSACKQTDKGVGSREGNNVAEESAENIASNTNGAVVGTGSRNLSYVFANDYGDKSIKYISWENVVKFIDYETIAWSTFDRMTGDGDYYIGTYTLEIQDNITFVNVHFDNGIDEKWLILANGTLCDIYKSGDRIPAASIHGVTGSVNRDEIIYFYGPVGASSYLTENGISYSPVNLANHWLDSPWVEGVEGYGINEKLFFEEIFSQKGSMYISIGYVSYDKPYLYNQNSRPKIIKLSVENKFSFEVELKDTPHYQEIKFPSDIDRDAKLILEILDVYAGTKYEDTCINSIYFEWSTGYYDIIRYWEDHPGL
jgi:hypothetical protein